MIQTVSMYLENTQARVSLRQYDQADVVRAVRRAGIDLERLSDPAAEFVCDCAVWAAVTHHGLLECVKTGKDKDAALDRLAHNIVEEIGANWKSRNLLLTQKNTALTVKNFLVNSGISAKQQEQAAMTVKAYLLEQIS